MDTIKNYLENMFASFPKTTEIIKLKEDLYLSMEDKYNELKGSGKTESEAIGIVISEFGNIDELVKELDLSIPCNMDVNSIRTISLAEAQQFFSDKKKYGRFIGIGVVLCIMSVCTYLFCESFLSQFVITSGNTELASNLAIIPLFLMIVIAVGIFIYSGMRLEKYKYLESPFTADYTTIAYTKEQQSSYQGTFTINLIIAVILCILSPLSLIILTSIQDTDFYNNLGILILLSFVSAAVYIFIKIGSVSDAYKQLLQEEDYSSSKKSANTKASKIIGIAASIIWPIAVVAYLLWSFLSNAWGISWIIFPIVGILFGGFSAVCTTLYENKS